MYGYDDYAGFSTDEETLVKLGFQSHDSDYDANTDEELRETRVKKKKRVAAVAAEIEEEYQHDRRRKGLISGSMTLQDVYDDMDEAEFRQLFRRPNEPVFSSPEIYRSMEGLLDVTFAEQEEVLGQRRRKRRQRRRRRKQHYGTRQRFNRCSKATKRILLSPHLFGQDSDGTLSRFVQELEKHLCEMIALSKEEIERLDSDETTSEDETPLLTNTLYVRFSSRFQKWIAEGVCSYYLLTTKDYDSEKVLVIKCAKLALEADLPSESLFSFLVSQLPSRPTSPSLHIEPSEEQESDSDSDSDSVQPEETTATQTQVEEVVKREVVTRVEVSRSEFFKIGRPVSKQRVQRRVVGSFTEGDSSSSSSSSSDEEGENGNGNGNGNEGDLRVSNRGGGRNRRRNRRRRRRRRKRLRNSGETELN